MAWHLWVMVSLIQSIQEAQCVPVPARDHERKKDTRHASNWRFRVWQAQVHGRETVSQVSIELGYLPSNTIRRGLSDQRRRTHDHHTLFVFLLSALQETVR